MSSVVKHIIVPVLLVGLLLAQASEFQQCRHLKALEAEQNAPHSCCGNAQEQDSGQKASPQPVDGKMTTCIYYGQILDLSNNDFEFTLTESATLFFPPDLSPPIPFIAGLERPPKA